MSNTVWPHRWQPTRLPHPWDSPGKNTGVGCHFLLQCMKVKSESEVTQSCPTLWDPMDCSLTDSPIHGIFQARVLEWGAIAFSILKVRNNNNPIVLQVISPLPFPLCSLNSSQTIISVPWIHQTSCHLKPFIDDSPRVWSLGQEDPLEQEMATHCSVVA